MPLSKAIFRYCVFVGYIFLTVCVLKVYIDRLVAGEQVSIDFFAHLSVGAYMLSGVGFAYVVVGFSSGIYKLVQLFVKGIKRMKNSPVETQAVYEIRDANGIVVDTVVVDSESVGTSKILPHGQTYSITEVHLNHPLQIESEIFRDVLEGEKEIEVRKDNFKLGDRLFLYEFHDGKYTGEMVVAYVTSILNSERFGCEEKFVTLGIRRSYQTTVFHFNGDDQ